MIFRAVMGLKPIYGVMFVWCVFHESCSSILLENFELSNVSFINKYTIVGILPKISLVKCASLCSALDNEPCGRFIWNSKSGLCMLNLNTQFMGTVIALENGDKLYNRIHTGCQAAGYLYNFETNTCIKSVPSTPINWYDARALCKQDGGDLISILTKHKWDLVVDYVQYTGIHWIGINARQWVNGNNFVNNLGIDVQVNNYDSAFPNGGPSCGLLLTRSGLPLQDESCLYRLYNSFICEIIII